MLRFKRDFPPVASNVTLKKRIEISSKRNWFIYHKYLLLLAFTEDLLVYLPALIQCWNYIN